MAGGMRAGSGGALLCLLVLLGFLAVAAHAHHKRQHSESLVSPAPFTFAARYGRSPERRIAPRNNRWMLTTRYGKRSPSFEMEGNPTPEMPPTLRERPPAIREGPRDVDEGPRTVYEGWGVRDEGEGVSDALSCVYTGVLALYRCTRTHASALTARKRSAPVLPSEED